MLATVSTALALVVLTALNTLEQRIPSVIYRSVSVVVPADRAHTILARCQEILTAGDARVQDVLHNASQESQRAEITFRVRTRNRLQAGEVVRRLMEIPEVVEARWH